MQVVGIGEVYAQSTTTTQNRGAGQLGDGSTGTDTNIEGSESGAIPRLISALTPLSQAKRIEAYGRAIRLENGRLIRDLSVSVNCEVNRDDNEGLRLVKLVTIEDNSCAQLPNGDEPWCQAGKETNRPASECDRFIYDESKTCASYNSQILNDQSPFKTGRTSFGIYEAVRNTGTYPRLVVVNRWDFRNNNEGAFISDNNVIQDWGRRGTNSNPISAATYWCVWYLQSSASGGYTPNSFSLRSGALNGTASFLSCVRGSHCDTRLTIGSDSENEKIIKNYCNLGVFSNELAKRNRFDSAQDYWESLSERTDIDTLAFVHKCCLETSPVSSNRDICPDQRVVGDPIITGGNACGPVCTHL